MRLHVIRYQPSFRYLIKERERDIDRESCRERERQRNIGRESWREREMYRKRQRYTDKGREKGIADG